MFEAQSITHRELPLTRQPTMSPSRVYIVVIVRLSSYHYRHSYVHLVQAEEQEKARKRSLLDKRYPLPSSPSQPERNSYALGSIALRGTIALRSSITLCTGSINDRLVAR